MMVPNADIDFAELPITPHCHVGERLARSFNGV
jgi:hypothetical protein